MDLDIYGPFSLRAEEYCSFAHETFSRIGHKSAYKISLKKFKKTEIIPIIVSKHNGMKPGINNRNNLGKFTNTWQLPKYSS